MAEWVVTWCPLVEESLYSRYVSSRSKFVDPFDRSGKVTIRYMEHCSCCCPNCCRLGYEAMNEWQAELATPNIFKMDYEDLRASQHAASHMRLMKDKIKRQNRLQGKDNRESRNSLRERKKRTRRNRTEKKKELVNNELSLENMESRFDSWSFFLNAQAQRSYVDHYDPEILDDTISEASTYFCFICSQRGLHRTVYEDSGGVFDLEEEWTNNYALFDPGTDPYRDLRSEARAKNRLRKQKDKYYGFRGSRPEWVGKPYYDLTTVVSSGTVIMKKRSTKKRRTEHYKRTETETPELLGKLQRTDYLWQAFQPQASLIAAGNQANTQRRLNGALKPRVGTLISSPIADSLFEDYRDFAERYRCYDSHLLQTLRQNPNAGFKLKVKTWTRKDNFADRTSFDYYWQVRRRHHSRKMDCVEKSCRGYKAREMQRNMKRRSQRLDAVGCQMNYLTSAGQKQLRKEETWDGLDCSCSDIGCERTSAREVEIFPAFPVLNSCWGEVFEEPKWWAKGQEDYVYWGDRYMVAAEEEEKQEQANVCADCEENWSSHLEPDFALSVQLDQDATADTLSCSFVADDWELLRTRSMESPDLSDIDRLSDLDDILDLDEWERLSNTFSNSSWH